MKNEKCYLLNEAAKMLGVPHYRIAYALTTGLVEEPPLRIANKRIFHDDDIRRLAAHFGVEPEKCGNGHAATSRRGRATGKTKVAACAD